MPGRRSRPGEPWLGRAGSAVSPPIIYNLFPTLAGPMAGWIEHAGRARRMGFNWLLLNPVMSFPESHDTQRLAAESGGSEAVQRPRYAFAAAFSEGGQMTVGYEIGFRRQLDVVRTRPGDWEEPAFDLSRFVGRVNGLKRQHPLLRVEAP